MISAQTAAKEKDEYPDDPPRKRKSSLAVRPRSKSSVVVRPRSTGVEEVHTRSGSRLDGFFLGLAVAAITSILALYGVVHSADAAAQAQRDSASIAAGSQAVSCADEYQKILAVKQSQPDIVIYIDSNNVAEKQCYLNDFAKQVKVK
jgi:hypothetical protein